MRHKPMALGSMTRKRDNDGVVRSGIGEGRSEGDPDSGCRRLMISEKAYARSGQGIRYECPKRCCIAAAPVSSRTVLSAYLSMPMKAALSMMVLRPL